MRKANFYMLPPYAVTEAEIVSGLPDAESQIFDAGTTYQSGDLVWYAGHAYRSAVDDNTGNTPGGAEWTDLGEVDQGALAYNAATTYATGNYAVYQGGLWKSAASGNTGNTPSEASEHWVRQGATNRLKAFDGFLQDEADLAGGLDYTLEFTGMVSHIALLRASGVTAQVTVTDDADGVVFDETYPLIDDSNIVDAWSYCFGQFITVDTVLVEDLPPYAGATIDISISGDAASVAQIVVGQGFSFGIVTVTASSGIVSYSVKDRDEFNRSIVVLRPYSDTALFPLTIPSRQTGYVKRILAAREALPTLYFRSGGVPYGMIAYGYFKEFDILHSSRVISDISLEIEGLG